MKSEEYLNYTAERRKQRIEIHKKKSHDYADEDALSNFKRVPIICRELRIIPDKGSKVALVYMILKLDRLCNLIYQEIEPNNEAVEDTILDMINYMELFDALYKEEKQANKIYVAHPYGRRRGESKEHIEANVDQAIQVTRELIKKGWNPCSPLLYHFVHRGWDETLDEDKWWELCASWIEDCNAFLICESSEGTERELLVAKRLKKKIYYNIDEVPNV